MKLCIGGLSWKPHMWPFFIILCSFLTACGSNSISLRTESANESSRLGSPVPKAEISYLGCWAGSGGGRIEISESMLIDLGSEESSEYREIKRDEFGTEGHERVLLKVEDVFKKSFLNQFILFEFRRTDVAYIYSYETETDVEADNYSGRGDFVKASCDEIRNERWKNPKKEIV